MRWWTAALEYARGPLGMPPDWQIFSFISSPQKHVPPGHFTIEGAVAKEVDGRRLWEVRDKATERKFIINDNAVTAWFTEFCRNKNMCIECVGEKQNAAKQVCSFCKGTGAFTNAERDQRKAEGAE